MHHGCTLSMSEAMIADMPCRLNSSNAASTSSSDGGAASLRLRLSCRPFAAAFRFGFGFVSGSAAGCLPPACFADGCCAACPAERACAADGVLPPAHPRQAVDVMKPAAWQGRHRPAESSVQLHVSPVHAMHTHPVPGPPQPRRPLRVTAPAPAAAAHPLPPRQRRAVWRAPDQRRHRCVTPVTRAADGCLQQIASLYVV